ncbi:MAG: ABC transporter permease [Oscillospiraceae bacterium]|jgi:teichoic acid transport system permease protein|nr:ABC transporter permease [Oscillospiraceae bacterium]
MKTLIEIIKEHIGFKSQIFKLAKSDIIRTYQGSALGWLWALIKPTITIFVYWFAFSIGIRKSGDVVVKDVAYPFFLWLIAGIVAWFYISEMLTQGTESIRKYNYLVTKMRFPVSTIPTFVSISKLIVHLILLTIVIVIFWAFGYPPDIYYLQLPFYIMCMFVFFTIFTLTTATLSAISKDFSNLVKSIVTAIFWISGILWDVDTIKIGWLKSVLMFNPVTFVCTGFRNVFINKIWFFEQPQRLYYLIFMTAFMLICSLFFYKKLRKDIPDVL